jgi:hypothetical protein
MAKKTPDHVDRECRRRMADAVLRFMRREIRSNDLDRACELRWQESDLAAHQAGIKIWLTYDDFVDHHIDVPPEGYEFLKRWLAFLRSDYGLTERPLPFGPRSRIVPAVMRVLLVAAATAWLLGLGPWLLVVTWLASGLVWHGIYQRRKVVDRELCEADRALRTWCAEVAPFHSVEDWQRHQHLVADVPPYDPAVHHVPFRSPAQERRMAARVAVGSGLLKPVLGVVVLPLWLPVELTGRPGSTYTSQGHWERTDAPLPTELQGPGVVGDRTK